MSNSQEPKRLAPPRQPLSLRELFCLTTLAAVTVAIVLYREWDDHERWLLGLTLSGTLLAIAATRAAGRRGWLAGILMGTIGGLIATCIIAQDWLTELADRESEGAIASDMASFESGYFWAAGTTVVVGILLALTAVACFQIASWLTASGERSFAAMFRRRPWLSSAALLAIVGGALALVNIDFLRAPRSWPAKHFLKLDTLEQPQFSNHGLYQVRIGSLSHNGEFLLVESYMPGLGREASDKAMYRLDPTPHVVSFTQRPDRASFVAFDCDANRVVFLEWLGEYYYDNPSQTHHLRVVELDRHTSTTLPEQPRHKDLHSLQWLPGGSLVIHYGDSYYGKKGFTQLREREGKWLREESEENATFDARSGQRLGYDKHYLRIVDAATNETIRSLPESFKDEVIKGLWSGDSLSLSPRGRFILAGHRIYDCETQSVCDWQRNGFLYPILLGFTDRDLLLLYDYPAMFVHAPGPMFLYDVPLVNRAFQWLRREPIRLIDPATGQEVARTRPLDGIPASTSFSQDGSRMAVFNLEGVYIYDVPAEFR